MLSSHAVKILRVMKHEPDWVYKEELAQKVPEFDYYAFNALVRGEYINEAQFEDDVPDFNEYGEVVYLSRYHISDKGLAYLERLASEKWSLFRSWAALTISLLAMAISALALFRSW